MKILNFLINFEQVVILSAPSLEYKIPTACNFKVKTKTLMNTLLCTLIYLFCSVPNSHAQFEKVIHQSFELGDRKDITLDIALPYEVETWAGNTILTETKVQLFNIPQSILGHFIKMGRYEIVEASNETSINLKLKEVDRRPIRTKNGECIEKVNIRIFVPEDCQVTTFGGILAANE